MINLLPPSNKEELKGEETFRLTLIVGVLSLLFFVCLSLLLLSIRIYVSGEIKAQSILVEAYKEQEQESPFQKIRRLNGDVVNVDAFYANQVLLADIIGRIAAATPEGIYLTSFNYTPPSVPRGSQQTANARVSLVGFAPTTEDLLALRAGLEQDALFGNFHFPPSNWILAEDIDFSFDFEIHSSPQ